MDIGNNLEKLLYQLELEIYKKGFGNLIPSEPENDVTKKLNNLMNDGLDDISNDSKYIDCVKEYRIAFNDFITSKFRNEFLSTEKGSLIGKKLIEVIDDCKQNTNK